jgi:hypothetical protein
MNPTPAKTRIIMAQVEGSGTALTVPKKLVGGIAANHRSLHARMRCLRFNQRTVAARQICDG